MKISKYVEPEKLLTKKELRKLDVAIWQQILKIKPKNILNKPKNTI